MIIMALDHVRDYLYSGSFFYDPLDPTQTSGILFFTRWITHFCAPVFMMLAGTSAYLMQQNKDKKELSLFLVKRGLWLVFLEMVLVNFGWNFNITFPMFFFITIWALGVSMIVLAGLIHLRIKLILWICIIIIVGHNLLDPIHVPGNSLSAFGWALLHDPQFFTWQDRSFLVGYPIVPLVAVMPLGYCLGALYSVNYDPHKRQRSLLILACVAVDFFVVLRYANVYGDPVKWSVQKDAFFTFLSFLNGSKYPLSLLYLSMALSTAFLFLSCTDKLKGAFVNVVSVFGRVPMFYYLIHIYVIHVVAIIASLLSPHQDWEMWILSQPIWSTSDLKGYGFSLPVAYLVWIGIVIALYPLCKRYDAYKQTHKGKWWFKLFVRIATSCY
ncbi:membrane protein, putative [Arcticibacter svalbardensis MN12-7]|uniref:Membrane protein, putative n=2 Tax=Arcticibacter TaxID=1288026 RepID=R9GYL3_9SPHI|nr:membrane protein, putative [Arcticibacter svalbardensis MN12-7]